MAPCGTLLAGHRTKACHFIRQFQTANHNRPYLHLSFPLPSPLRPTGPDHTYAMLDTDCLIASAVCPASATVGSVLPDGSVSCVCKPGYTGDGSECVIDPPILLGGSSRTIDVYKNTVYRLDGPGLLATNNSATGVAWFGHPQDQNVTTEAVANTTSTKGGTYNVSANGALDFTPKKGYTGLDTFTISATYGQAPSSPVTITLNVQSEFSLAPDCIGCGRLPTGTSALDCRTAGHAESNATPPTPRLQPNQTDRKPPLAKPRVKAAALYVAAPTNAAGKCGKTGINITATAAAGKITVLSKGTSTLDVGAPAGLTIEIAKQGEPATPRCKQVASGAIGPEGKKEYVWQACSKCNACFKELGFNCTAPQQYVMRVTAKKTGSFDYSPISDEFVLNVTCAPGAEGCVWA